MPTIQRPLKTYGTRTYAGEVAAAPGNEDPILANEVDADLDTVYTAWNNTLAQGILWQISGTTLTPTDATKTVAVSGPTTGSDLTAFQFGTRTQKGRLMALPVNDTVALTKNRRYDGSAWQRDDTAQPSWTLNFSSGDNLSIVRESAAGVAANLLALDSAGNLTIGGGLTASVDGGPPCPVLLTGAGGASGLMRCRGSRGTLAAPTPSLSGDIIAQWSGAGCHVNGSYSDQATVKLVATENWTNTARGTYFIVNVTPAGSTTASSYMNVDKDGNILISGSVGQKSTGTTWANPSDRRLKKNITPYVTGLEAIQQLAPMSFQFNGKGGSQDGLQGYGFLADEVESVMPEMVGSRRGKLEDADEEETDIQTLDSSNITLALVNAVKELATRVTALEAR